MNVCFGFGDGLAGSGVEEGAVARVVAGVLAPIVGVGCGMTKGTGECGRGSGFIQGRGSIRLTVTERMIDPSEGDD